MGGYQRYEAYQNSGIEWLGEIPAHWKVMPLKHIADVRGGITKGRKFGGVETLELPYMRVANVQAGYIDISDISTIEVPVAEVERYSLRAGDVLMNEGGDNDKLGRGAVWTAPIAPCLHQNHVFAVRPNERNTSDWIGLISLSNYAKFYFFSKANQSTNLASISATNLKSLPIVFPPLEEQKTIAHFLDYKTAQIDALIAKKASLLKKLAEKRSALISQAVTKGLNPKVPMKDSGVEWLGEVPAHWEVLGLKRLADVRGGVTKGRKLGDVKVRIYRICCGRSLHLVS
jgi:type I restriction enzyme, S subunit